MSQLLSASSSDESRGISWNMLNEWILHKEKESHEAGTHTRVMLGRWD